MKHSRKGKSDRATWELEDVKRLNELWNRHTGKITKASIAAKLECHPSLISQFFSGDTALTWRAVLAFAEVLHVSPHAISPTLSSENLPAGWEGNISPGPNVVSSYPLLGSVPGGDFREIFEALRNDPETRWIPSFKKLPGLGFYLRVSGTSMSPTISDGDLILVDPDAEPKNRSIVVVRNGHGEATVKRLIRDGDIYMLVPDNQQYPAKPLGDCKLVGVVVASHKDLAI